MSATVTRKRRDTRAYRDGETLAYLRSAESALIRLVGDRRAPEHADVEAAFCAVLRAEQTVKRRAETRAP